VAESTDWDVTGAALRDLQAEWKKIGPAPRADADALWNRFRAACDRFFDRHRRRHELAREELGRQARAVCDTLEALATSLAEEGAAPDAAETLDTAWSEWIRLDVTSLADAAALDARLDAACERIAATRPDALRGTRLDPEATRARREKLVARVEELAASTGPDTRTLSLQEMALALRERLATNTIAGGKGNEPVRKRDAAAEVERIAATWARLGPALGEDARALAERFQRARERLRTKGR
jgi:hypothetical protein